MKRDNLEYTMEPLLTPIENSEQDISKLKQEKIFRLKNFKPAKKIINIVFIILIVLLCLISLDIVLVSKYEKGPIFAIPTKVYTDGGTKEYLGLGYKVINYNQKQGRRDMQVGTWGLKYNTRPISVTDLDLALEFGKEPKKAIKRYYGKFLRITGVVKAVDKKTNQLLLEYVDDGGKYKIDINCTMAEDKNDLKKYKKGDYVYVLGTLRDFKQANDMIPNTVFIENTFSQKQG
jgi:hypothetical protein